MRSVIAGDCRDVIGQIDSSSVSLILTDPPYFIEGMDEDWSHQNLRSKAAKSNGVVGGLPGGMRFDSKQGRALQNFMQPVAEQWMRVLKPGGFVLAFSQPRLIHRMAVAIEDAGFELRDTYAWRYTRDGQCKAFTQDHFVRKSAIDAEAKERLIESMGGRKTPQLKPQMEMVIMAQKPKDGTFVENWMAHGVGLIDMESNLLEYGESPGTVMVASKASRIFGHMTVKPVKLLRHLLRIFSPPNAVVLDPFAGTGSTGVAAAYEGRRFVGFELDDAMAENANRRIDAALRGEAYDGEDLTTSPSHGLFVG